jgi:hypothetical protein
MLQKGANCLLMNGRVLDEDVSEVANKLSI